MKTMNRPKQVRETLGLTQTKAGELFTGQSKKLAYDTWSRWERTGKWPAPAEKLFNIVLRLKKAEDDKTRNCHGALKLVLHLLEESEG